MRKFNITVSGKSYFVEVEEVAGAVTVPDQTIKSEQVLPVEPIQMESAPAPKAAPAQTISGETVACPMPGTIVAINVSEGDAVKRGDLLMILEAMKMENEIMTPVDGRVAKIGVSKGESVNTGDMLAVIA